MKKVLVTGSTGRVGRAVYINLMRKHQVVGIDRLPCSTVDHVLDLRDSDSLLPLLKNIDVVVHVAGLHAPHVGICSDEEFWQINVEATCNLFELAAKQGMQHFVYTSTTALYGAGNQSTDKAAWITEQTIPKPRTIYHRSKVAAELQLQALSRKYHIPVTVLQMSRCFPEPADQMALYRLTRGIDARDVASAHAAAIDKCLAGFNRFIISGKTPFIVEDCQQLWADFPAVVRQKVPQLAKLFSENHWQLPKNIDRVYDAALAKQKLGWQSEYGADSVIQMLNDGFAEVLPVLKCGQR